MEFQTVVNKRKMIRSFQEKMIPDETLDRLVKNFFKGPSAGFSQGFELLILRNSSDREKFYEQWRTEEQKDSPNSLWSNLKKAPVILVLCANKQDYLDRYAEPDKGWTDRSESHWPIPWWYCDTAMAGLLVLLTAVDEELGAVLTGVVDMKLVRNNFRIPSEYEPMAAISIGYAEANDPQSPSLKRGHRSLKEVTHYDQW